MGNIELYELSETLRTTQCLACLRHSKEGTSYCGCGKCLIPLQEHTDNIKRRFDILADPLLVVKRGRAGELHGPQEWQYHHWKVVDAAKKCKKREFESIAKRWRDDLSYWDTQQKHRWSLEYCMFLVSLKTIKITYKATRTERDRYKNQLVLRWKIRRSRARCQFTKILEMR